MVNLVIPFYNEAINIPFFLEKMTEYLATNRYVDVLTMVNDGSKDNTLSLLKQVQAQLSEKFPQCDIQLLDASPNQGKGNAIRVGILAAKSDWVLSLDADLATLPNQLDQWVDQQLVQLNKKDKIYIASREMGIDESMVDYKLHRRIIGRIFFLLVFLFTGIKERDTQCGFKLYPTPLAQSVFRPLKDKGFAHDVEILYRLNKKGIPIQSLPVKWEERGNSKVNLLTDSLRMLFVIVKMRFSI